MRKLGCAVAALLVVLGVAGCRSGRKDVSADSQLRPVGPVDIVLRNPLDRPVRNAPVFIKAQRLPSKEFYILDPKSAAAGLRDAEVIYQIDDLNGDGRPDEVFFQISMGPGETRRLRVVPAPLRRFGDRAVRAFVYQHESTPVIRPVLESALAGYYTYGASKLDVFGKIRPGLTADKIFTAKGSTQHDWSAELGVDYLPVGLSMGAGAVFLSEDPQDRTRVSRPWTKNSFLVKELGALGRRHEARYAYRVTVDGPLRAIVDTRITDWQTDAGIYALSMRQTVFAHQRYLRWTVWVDHVNTSSKGLLFGAGFRALKEETKVLATDSFLASVSQDVYAPVSRRKPAAWLGLALMFSPNDLKQTADTPTDGGNHLVLLDVIPKRRVTFCAAAAWDKDGGIITPSGWFRQVGEWAEELNHPVQVVAIVPREQPTATTPHAQRGRP